MRPTAYGTEGRCPQAGRHRQIKFMPSGNEASLKRFKEEQLASAQCLDL